MSLPPTRYIEAGPGMPMADPGAAAAQASAYAGLGNTIAQLGAAGMQMAARVRQIEDGGKIAEFSARMEKTASDFSIQLMTREDTEKWPGDWQKTAEALRQEAKKLGISSGALAQFEQKFTQWNTRLTIGFETQAATKSIEIARGRVANAYQFHLDNQNYEAARDTLSTAHATGILDSVALEKGLMDTDKAARHNDVLADINDDAAVWLNDNTNPLPGYDMAEWNRLRSHARSVERQVTYEQSANVMDRIITGHISRPEQIEQEAAMLRPTERAKLTDFLASYQRAEADNLRHNPDWQAEQVGRFNALLADYVPVTGDSPDMPGVELNGIVKAMPDGPLKDDMTRQVRAVLDNQQAEAKTALDLQLAEVTAAAKRGQFDPPTAEPEEFDTDRALRDGWLSEANVQNLQGLGYSQNQAKEIVGEDDLNKRRNKFRELWQHRENKEATGRPWDEAVKDALLDGRSTFTLEGGADPDELSANRALRTGKIEIQMRDWARQHPELARDPEKIRAQLHKISGMEFRRPAARLSAPPRRAAAATGEVPTETSMNSLPAPLQPLAPVFEQAGRAHGIDPRFLMAISMHETANGQSSAFRNKRNAMGVSNSKGPIAFEDPAESVHRMARVLSSPKGPYRNARTLAQIGQVYAPIGAGNDPRSLNKHWTAGVSKYLRQLGGDPNQIFLNA